jgi:hypothetical protein
MRTEITELATGLGMLGYDSPERALVRRPREFTDVDDDTWTRFVRTVDAPDHRIDFAGAHANGQAFLCSDDGLRGRRPLLIEWKGSHRAPTSDSAPVDLRIDHVFLVSCKYASKILLNAAPATLFAGGPAARDDTAASDWFTNVSPEAHQALYSEVRAELGVHGAGRPTGRWRSMLASQPRRSGVSRYRPNESKKHSYGACCASVTLRTTYLGLPRSGP